MHVLAHWYTSKETAVIVMIMTRWYDEYMVINLYGIRELEK